MPFHFIYLFIFLLKEHFLHATGSLCGSAPVCRFRTCPQSRFSDDKHHWPLGKHLKSTLHLDSPALTLSVTRTNLGSLKRKKKKRKKKTPLQKPFLLCLLSVCSQRFSNEILKSQPSHKTAGNVNSVPFLSSAGFRVWKHFCPSPKNNSNHTTITRRKISNNFAAHDSEGAPSPAWLTLVRRDLEVLLMLQTPAALHPMSASRIGFRKAAFIHNTRYFLF